MCIVFKETCTIKLKLTNISYHVIGIYRPHSGSVEDFIAELVTLFSKVTGFAHQNIILLGDLNINSLEEKSNKSQSLCYFMRSNCVIPVKSCATRYSPEPEKSSSLLDHIWFNCFDT